jgi:hypothetical protein
MTAADLTEIIRSPDFRTGLEEISSYLASIMQEGPMVHLLAKCLWKQKHLYALERNERHDLTIWTPNPPSPKKEATIEVKFNFETCSVSLAKELEKCGGDIGGIVVARATAAMKKNNRGVLPRIFRDICEKKSDLFLWIICSRDLSNISADVLERIVGWKPLKSYRRTRQYKTDSSFLDVVDSFLEKVNPFRPFSVTTAEIETNGDFPSTYHFRICEFAKAGQPATAAARQEPRPPDESKESQ